MQKNDIVELEISGVTLQGDGIARLDGVVVFVPGVCPGDVVRALILKVKPNCAFGKCLAILSPAPQRVDASCAVFPRCGGCAFRCLAYCLELQIKEQEARETLRRIGGIEAPVRPILGAAQPDRYRNKAMMPLAMDADGHICGGFYTRGSHRVVRAEDCQLQPEAFLKLSAVVCQWAQDYGCTVYDETTGKGLLRHIYLRQAQEGAQIMVCLVINGQGVPRADVLIKRLRAAHTTVKSILLNHNTDDTNVILGARETLLWGKEYISEMLCGLKFALSPQAFFQVNPAQAQRLYALAGEYAGLTGTQRVLDLYCGTGAVGLTMAARCAELVGVEVAPQAVENAKQNAQANEIANARFLCMDAQAAARRLAAEDWRPDVVLADPPRKGCEPELLETIAQMRPARMVYISCDPATLARDLALLAQLGYTTEEITPVDMFPRTGHVECVAKLTRTA
ncbi:MAG: 23S rRNA (uracil(1939)-C(5))-methyltransferase RlmD [Oscillospiraceae bacterium]|jgi:23S rRNA (uracil1939-C5)-methyltransferase|nr:23S rRNA (uracil(1939)-C(5))-methyltransferase RlmD [Oscillospiraceae bacterium]